MRINPRAVVAERVAWAGLAVFVTSVAALGLYAMYHALSGPLIGPAGAIPGEIATSLITAMGTSLLFAFAGILAVARHRKRVETANPEQVRPDIAA